MEGATLLGEEEGEQLSEEGLVAGFRLGCVVSGAGSMVTRALTDKE